jgi:phosphoribosyl 1,2-cyclic phosphodiesterase
VPSLFARDITVCVLSSGSAGNCAYVGDGHAGLLIDCGLSTRQVKERMAASGLADAPIDAVLVTHEHGDHVGAAGVLARELARRKVAVPFFMTAGTRQGLDTRCVPEGIEVIQAGGRFRVKHLVVEALPIPHDTRDPVAYRVSAGDVVVAVVTDLGRPTALLARALRDCTVAVLEFNHDEEMLMNGPYPFPVKQRIKSSHGHLSNRQAQDLLAEGLGNRLTDLVLAHLSEENNTPARAAAAAQHVLGQAGRGVRLHVGQVRAPLPPLTARAERW